MRMKCAENFKSVWNNPGPDKGWSWVIAFGLWITGFPAYGIFGTLGVIYPAVKDTLQISQEEASWPFFLSSVTANLVGIALPVVTRIMTARQLLTCSLALYVFGGVVCFIAPKSILILCVFYGVPYGIFHGFFMHSSFVIVAQYFNKYRASALAILLTAPAIAMFTLPMLIQYLLTVHEYRGALLLVAGFAAQSFPAIFLLRPRTQSQFHLNSPQLVAHKNSNIVIRKMDKSVTRKMAMEKETKDCIEQMLGDHQLHAFVQTDSTPQMVDMSYKVSEETATLKPKLAPESQKYVPISNLKNDILNTLKRPECVLVVLPDAAIMTSYIFVYILMVAHAKQCGISSNAVQLAYLSFGVSALILRIAFALMIDKTFVRKDILIYFSFLAALCNAFFYIFWNTSETFIFSAVLFSFSISSYQSLRLSQMTKHFPPKDIPILISFSSIFSSSISLVTPKLIGLSYALTGDYRPLWMFSSILLVLSIIVLIVDSFCKKSIDQRNRARGLNI